MDKGDVNIIVNKIRRMKPEQRQADLRQLLHAMPKEWRQEARTIVDELEAEERSSAPATHSAGPSALPNRPEPQETTGSFLGVRLPKW